MYHENQGTKMPGGYSRKDLEDTSMDSYETWRSARPHPPSNPFGDALPPRPQGGGSEEDETLNSHNLQHPPPRVLAPGAAAAPLAA